MQTVNMTRRANISVLLVFLFLTALEFTAKRFMPSGSHRYAIIAVVELIVFFVPAMFLLKSQEKKAKIFLRLKRFRFKWIPLIFTASLSASLGGILLNILLSALSGKLSPANSQNSTVFATPEAIAISFAALAIVPPIVEEIYFRGAVLSSFENKNLKSGIIASSLLFGMLHSSQGNFFGPFLAGVAYALLTVVFDSVYPAILAHFINNALSSIILYYSKLFFNIGLDIYIIIFIFLLFLLFLYLTLKLVEPYLVKKTGFAEDESSLKQRLVKYRHSPVFSAGFLIITVLWIAKLIIRFMGKI